MPANVLKCVSGPTAADQFSRQIVLGNLGQEKWHLKVMELLYEQIVTKTQVLYGLINLKIACEPNETHFSLHSSFLSFLHMSISCSNEGLSCWLDRAAEKFTGWHMSVRRFNSTQVFELEKAGTVINKTFWPFSPEKQCRWDNYIFHIE